MTIEKHPERRDENLPLLTLMGEPNKPKKEEPPAAAAPADNTNGTFKYPELPFKKPSAKETVAPEKKEDSRPITKLFKRGEDNKPTTRTIDFGDPDKWGEVYGNPAIYYDIESIVALDETADGPILVKLKDGKKFFSCGAKYEQTCNELNTDLSLLEIKMQYWK